MNSSPVTRPVASASTAPVSGLAPVPVWLRALVLVLFMVRACGALLGLDQLPLLPSVPAEVLINDPALALAEGHGLVGPGFAHSVNGMDKLYAHFPPVFIVLQSLVYRAFGLSAYSLRGLSAVDGLFAMAVFLAVFLELYRRGLIDSLGLMAGSALLLLEPTTLLQARQGRMESTNVLFGAVALYLTVRASRLPRQELRWWIASAVVAGFSLSTHPSGILFVPALALWSLPRVRRFGFRAWVLVNSLPLAVFASIWGLAYGASAVAALKQMQVLASYAPKPSLALGMLVNVLARRAVAELQQTGSLALVAIVVAPLLAALRWFVIRRKPASNAPVEWSWLLAGSAVVLALQCLLIAFALPWSGPNRIVMAAPFAFLATAVAVSFLPRVAWKAVFTGVALFALAEAAVAGGYFSQLRGGGGDRGSNRLDPAVESISPDARVAAVPEFWYAFHHNGRPVTLLYHALNESTYWNEAPGVFDEYDVVILDPTTPDYANLLARARAVMPSERMFHSWRRDFTVLQRRTQSGAAGAVASLPGSGLAGARGETR